MANVFILVQSCATIFYIGCSQSIKWSRCLKISDFSINLEPRMKSVDPLKLKIREIVFQRVDRFVEICKVLGYYDTELWPNFVVPLKILTSIYWIDNDSKMFQWHISYDHPVSKLFIFYVYVLILSKYERSSFNRWSYIIRKLCYSKHFQKIKLIWKR